MGMSRDDNQWKGIARTAIGSSHKITGMPCQDVAEWRTNGDIAFAALADGAGSARYAESGAKVAVSTALKILQDHVEKNPDEIETIFTNFLEKIINELKEVAQLQKCEIQDLACTLNVVVLAPDWIAMAQVGDGFIVYGCEGEFIIPFKPDKGEYANETTFITSSNATIMEAKINKKIDFVCISSDGLYDVSTSKTDNIPYSPFFTPLVQFMKVTEDPEKDDEYLTRFLHSERLARYTDDDKSIILITRK
jgi:serine/threonine protein phosphatase PrpC